MRFEPRAPREGINVSREHPLEEASLLVAGLAGVLVLAGVVITLGVDVAVRLIPPDFESRAFQTFAPGDVEADPSVASRVRTAQAILDSLARHWPDAPYTFRVRLLDDEMLNAAALPGGWVLVTRGLLETAGSENELAFVLGHELGHFHGRHHLRRLGRQAVYGLALAAVLGRSGGAQSLGSLTGELTSRGFDRGQEREADAFGLRLIAAEYGHAAGSTAFFERIDSLGGPRLERFVAYFSTHPGGRERIADIERMATEAHLSMTGPLLELESNGGHP
jgi:predicted Zn-dependent protease